MREAGPCRGSLHAVWDTCMIETQFGMDIERATSKRHFAKVPQGNSLISIRDLHPL